MEVDASPGINLVKTLAEIRDRYEDINEKNQREAEAWHKQQVGEAQQLATNSCYDLLSVTSIHITSQCGRIGGRCI